MPKSNKPAAPRQKRAPTTRLAKWLWAQAGSAGFKNDSGLATAANLPISTIHAIKRGRDVSPRVWKQIAAVLQPPQLSLREFTEEFVDVARLPKDKYLAPESRVEMVTSRRELNAVVITSTPFVNPEEASAVPSGFAVSLFREIARLMGVQQPRFRRSTFADLPKGFKESEHCVVSAVLPTFRKSRFMAFSHQLPFLRIGLSAVARREDIYPAGRSSFPEITINDLLYPDSAARSGQAKLIRFAYANGGAADDFVTTFPQEIAAPQPIILPEPTVSQFLENLRTKGGPVVIADMATCRAIVRAGAGDIIGVPKHPQDLTGACLRFTDTETQDQGGRLEFLARYPVTFGLPHHDDDWITMFNDAMNYLLTERIRPVLSLYLAYVHEPAFREAFDPDDPYFLSHPMRRAFQNLRTEFLKTHEVW